MGTLPSLIRCLNPSSIGSKDVMVIPSIRKGSFNSGVVPSIALAIQSYTQEGDAVLIHDPVYHPLPMLSKTISGP